jgi:hypothetical protein
MRMMEEHASPLARKIKTALDETRLLILGSQVLLGFQLNGIFQERFSELAASARQLAGLALVMMVLAVALLIAPSMQHRLVEEGNATLRIFRLTGRMAGAALMPFALSMGIDHYVVYGRLFGPTIGAVGGGAFLILAIVFWYGLEYLAKRKIAAPRTKEDDVTTPISIRVEQMLTEARVVLPGAQALLGFQLAVTLTRAFDELPYASRLVHAGALGLVALSVILLMAPAAFHRIAFDGRDTEAFHTIGSRLVVAATVPLAAGIAGDVHVAIARITESSTVGLLAAAAVAVALAGLWYVHPLLVRRRLRRR